MPIYTIQGPDGKVYDIEMPSEGAGAPAVGGSHTQPAAQAPEGVKPFERAGGYSPVMAGVAEAAIKGGLGIKQLFGGLTDEQKAVLREVQAESKADPNGFQRGVGEVGANLLATAIPGMKAAGALNKTLGVMGRAAPIATSALTSGVSEAVLAPGEGDTYGEQMLSKGKEAGKAAVAGAALTGALTPVAGLFKASKEAKELMSKGMYPTLQQGSESWLGKTIGAMSGGAGASSVAKRQNKEVVQATLKKMLPGVDVSDLDTDHMVQAILQGREKEFSDILGKKIYKIALPERGEMWKAARAAAGSEPDVLQSINRSMGDAGIAIRSKNPVRLSYESMTKQRDMLQDQINVYAGPNASSKDKMIAKGLIAAKNKFDDLVRNKQLNQDELDKLADLNARNIDMSRFVEAAANPTAQRQMKASDLLRSYAKSPITGGQKFAAGQNAMQQDILGPADRVMGLTPSQDDTRAGIVALRRTMPFLAGAGVGGGIIAGGAPAAAVLAPGYGLSLLGQTKKGARALFGDYEVQKMLAEELRKRGGGLAAGSALTTQEE